MAEPEAVSTARRIVLVVEYDGANYYGFQLQSTLPTIQEQIEKALTRLTGEQTRLASASRTDTGVHAKGQVLSFRTQATFAPKVFVNGLNYYLPADIAVKAAYHVADSFDVRRNAVSREYRYYVLNSPTRSPLRERFCYRVKGKLDTDLMSQACAALIGVHDFASFASQVEDRAKSTVRHVYQANIERVGELVVFSMTANAFLTHQIRNTVGALLRIGLGRLSIEEFNNIISAKQPGLAGPAAPAHALFLMRINYPSSFGERSE